MPTAPSPTAAERPAIGEALLNRNRLRILGLTPDEIIKYFFNGNAIVAIIVNAGNSVKGLTKKQVEQIFTGDVTDW
ncbi:MAG: hypothetical protein ABIS29_11845, partial [Vicinamibacterales bacterium]